MKFDTSSRALGMAAAALALAAGGLGYGLANWRHESPPGATAQSGRKILYWYDPMVPSQHFDKPGKSPFMDMELVPKYADEAASGETGVAIDPSRTQSLGLRIAEARTGMLGSSLAATGTIEFNERDIAIVQARTGGFVQRVYARAPGDVIGAGAPLADILVPEWAGAQAEYLAVRRIGDVGLARAARQRLLLLGMPTGTVAAVERSGRPHNVVTISAPTGGTIKTLGVRAGMTVASGQTLAEVNGLGTVWLNAAVPEAMAGRLRPGQSATATLAAYPGERLPAASPRSSQASPPKAGRSPCGSNFPTEPGACARACSPASRLAAMPAGAAGAERSGDPHGQAHARHAGRRRRALSSRRGPHRPPRQAARPRSLPACRPARTIVAPGSS
jgi:Cu(I)/Ag(I) efflux system membrane fusion protein